MADRASWIEISKSAYAHNVAMFRRMGIRKVGAVLKGNAYGHGFEQIVPLAVPAVDVCYVITPDEGLRIRAWEAANKRTPCDAVVMGAFSPDEAVSLARERVAAVVAGVDAEEAVAALRKAGLKLRIHLHFDTGLSREGFTAEQLAAGEADFITRHPDVFEVVGLMSHLARADDVTDQSYARSQMGKFEAACGLVATRFGLKRVERHLAASSAVLALPTSRYDVARLGIALYGLWPSHSALLSSRLALAANPGLTPVLSWRVTSQLTKWVEAGSYVGYDCTYRCPTKTRVAVLPVGYWDGYPRVASGRAYVLVKGRRCAVLGRVMMNHLVIDVSEAAPDDASVTATLIGRDGDESIGAALLAEWAQTINYEIVTRLGTHLERRHTD